VRGNGTLERIPADEIYRSHSWLLSLLFGGGIPRLPLQPLS
jgi:hypothetical protein